jgi:hypothetical protein
MTFEFALSLTEILMGFALLQQSLEYIVIHKRYSFIFITRAVLCILLISGIQIGFVLGGLFFASLIILYIYQAPFNGGSDRLSLLMQFCLCIVTITPSQQWAELFFAYLGAQVILSYFIAGWVKIKNPDWRSGQALIDVFSFSTYPISQSIRRLAHYPSMLFYASWIVILLELIFPFAFINQMILATILFITAIFHLANAFLFGLNRFFWIWIATYPCLFWLQGRIIGL